MKFHINLFTFIQNDSESFLKIVENLWVQVSDRVNLIGMK